MYSSPNIIPFSSKKTSLSTSGSTAIPKSDLFTLIDSDKSVKFSAKGSGIWLNTPFISEFIILYFIFSLSNNLGIAIEPPELIASALTDRFRSFISLTGKIFRFKIAST